MPNDDDIYQDHVMDHYEDPFHRGTCPSATHAHEAKNPLCGDVVRMELRIGGDGRIVDAWFDGQGCVISQASASILTEKVQGMTVDEVRQINAETMLQWFGPRLTPNRQKCCLLSWRVVQSAVFSPLEEGDEESRGPSQGGPHLGEEQ
jgi:nitrogen fixation protein NifU and related proteins